MKLLTALFILCLLPLFHSCREIGRNISSIEDYQVTTPGTFSAKLVSMRNNGRRVSITGGCDKGMEIRFISEFLEDKESNSTYCNEGTYEKKLYFKKGVEGRKWIQVREANQSIDVLIPYVDTKDPGPVVVKTPIPRQTYGSGIMFSGFCEKNAKVFIRSYYLDNILRTGNCANGIFVIFLFLKEIVAEQSQIIFSLYQVDQFGNSSKPILFELSYRNSIDTLVLDEQMIPVVDSSAFISGICGDYTKVSINGSIIKCENNRFSYTYEVDVNKLKNERIIPIVVEGLQEGGKKSNVKVVIIYQRAFNNKARFYSPIGTYDKQSMNNLYISGTCGVSFLTGNVRLYTQKKKNILKSGGTIPIGYNGNFFVSINDVELDGEERIYAECSDYYISYQTNNFFTEFNFGAESNVRRVERVVYVQESNISLTGNCNKRGIVSMMNVANGVEYKAECIDGGFNINFESDRLWGTSVFEIHEENLFEEIVSKKQVINLKHETFLQYPSKIYVEASSPLWGARDYDVILYWNYFDPKAIKNTYYGYYSKDSFIQVDWKKLPVGANHLIVRGRDLLKLGYEECSEVQVFLKAQGVDDQYSISVESKAFYFDFTPPRPIRILDIDYRPLFNNQLPIFIADEIDDNCTNYEGTSWLKGFQWFEVKLYKIDLINSSVVLVDEKFLMDLKKINEFGFIYDLEGLYQIGITAVDMGFNKSEEYRSIVFSWK